ncbi:MAG: GldG family protein, partial [Chloroflexota bacterium]|nr:GldG family protein [Chloroflexota bacterium]
VMAVLVVVIIGAVNYFVDNHNKTFDVTKNGLHTLSDQTVKLLQNLNQDVTVTAFFQTGQFDEQQAKDLLALYAGKSDKFHYTFVDPDKDPATAQRFGIVSYGTTVFQSGGRRKDVPSAGEQDFTSALLAVTNQVQRKIYFVTGNGQPDPNSSDQLGYHDALAALQNDNYVVDTLNATITAIPDDAAAVILPGGASPLLAGEKKALQDYLAKGGKMLVMSNAIQNRDVAKQSDLNDLLKPYGLTFQPGIVIDPASSLPQDPSSPAVSSYAAQGNDIVKNVPVSLFPVANGIDMAAKPPQGISLTAIANTSGQSWLQNHTDRAEFRQGDIRGPITLFATASGTLASAQATPAAAGTPAASGAAAAVPTSGALANATVVATPPPATPTPEASPSGSPSAAPPAPTTTPTPPAKLTGADVNLRGGTKIVAVSDQAWMNNNYLNRVPGNRALFLNSINYLVGNTALLSIPPKPAATGQVFLLGSDANLIFFVTVILVPLAVLLVGGVVWWQRR